VSDLGDRSKIGSSTRSVSLSSPRKTALLILAASEERLLFSTAASICETRAEGEVCLDGIGVVGAAAAMLHFDRGVVGMFVFMMEGWRGGGVPGKNRTIAWK